jgi:hypothetical protein
MYEETKNMSAGEKQQYIRRKAEKVLRASKGKMKTLRSV